MRSDLEDIEVHMHHQTDGAVLVSLDGERDSAVWVPKSQCEIEHKRGFIWLLTASAQTLVDKGLV